MPLKSQLESLLFVAIKPLSSRELAGLVKGEAKDVEAALQELAADYSSRQSGLAIVKNNGQYQLTSAADNANLVQDFLKTETSGELSQPSLEALTIIAYRGPIAKSELDHIRGINCSLIIRNLLLRGLIEEKFDSRKEEHYYSVTHDFIRFLGIPSVEELPDYSQLHRTEAIKSALDESADAPSASLD